MKDQMEDIKNARDNWQKTVVDKRVKRFNLQKSPTRFFTPKDIESHSFLEKVGFPGEYPFTAGNNPFDFWRAYAEDAAKMGYRPDWGGAGGVGKYGGFGTAEDYRDYLKRMHAMNRKGGPNIAFDLATQCGYDSDNEMASGEIGRVGVAIDSLGDFKTIYEPYTGDLEIDKVPSNFTINAPAAVIIAMYAVMAESRGIPLTNLKGTPQNDILKEFIARGTYIYPPKASLRLFRDTCEFCTRKMPKFNINSIGGYHMREAGASREQDLAFSMSNGIAYLQAGIDAGLGIDEFAPQFTFNAFGGSMQIYHEIAFQRAARRMWARIVKEQFGAKNKRSMLIRQPITAHIGCISTTRQRTINNLPRAVIGGIAAGMSGGIPGAFPPFDEPLGLGHSQEAVQLQLDATRIMIYEAGVADVNDPWAGSYFMENLTDEIEANALAEMDKIKKMGGAIHAIESGYMARAIAKSAYEHQKRIESQEDLVVGVNCFNTENEIDVTINRVVESTYDPQLMETAEKRQIEKLSALKRGRDNTTVLSLLNTLRDHASDESVNLMSDICECVKNDVTLQEICDVLRDVFGVHMGSDHA
ncbi:MAG: methylmalonyl-CoA mutase, large subunit [Candidatus Magnetoglobus multicellularis str. Araruama]|uniref:Methylmalonyl-CoA mutase, large subunit n=1 Tax=Candidatus Magnetoglobus multicellularis str. Araruama TaxID=890399 RepID=A0A1V1NWD9_9BACT|nr:MAG: methylmalonyl-CoA mutase, large subunit [Candidatus Magnetoglobus multicellularis str. Araruama]